MDDSNPSLVSIACGIIATIFINTIIYLSNSTENMKLIFDTKIRFRNKYIRFSISYLFRIKIDGKYLLIKGDRIPQYQPIGGVFKRYGDSDEIFRKLGVLDDDKIPADNTNRDDLRIRVKGKMVLEFLNWFKNGHGREVSAEREFFEELIQTGLLPKSVFPYLKYRFIKREQEEIKYDEHFECQQLLIAEIYELILDESQLSEIKKLTNLDNGICSLVTEGEISRLGASVDGKINTPIARTAKWII